MTAKKRKEAFLRCFEERGTVADACKMTGIGKNSINQYLREDEEFFDRFQEIRKHQMGEIEDCVFKQALEGSERSQHFLLRAWNPERYAPDRNVNVKVSQVTDVRIAGKDPATARIEMTNQLIEQLRNVPGGEALLQQLGNELQIGVEHVPIPSQTLDIESERYRTVQDCEQADLVDEDEQGE